MTATPEDFHDALYLVGPDDERAADIPADIVAQLIEFKIAEPVLRRDGIGRRAGDRIRVASGFGSNWAGRDTAIRLRTIKALPERAAEAK